MGNRQISDEKCQKTDEFLRLWPFSLFADACRVCRAGDLIPAPLSKARFPADMPGEGETAREGGTDGVENVGAVFSLFDHKVFH